MLIIILQPYMRSCPEKHASRKMKKHLKVTSMLSCTEYRNTLRYWCFTTVSSELISPPFRKPLIFVFRWWPNATIVTCRLLFTFLLWLSQITLHFLVVSRIFYRPQTKFAKVLFSTGVCLSTDGGFRFLSRGVSVRETPRTDIPPYGNERAVCILLECILVIHKFIHLLRIHFYQHSLYWIKRNYFKCYFEFFANINLSKIWQRFQQF